MDEKQKGSLSRWCTWGVQQRWLFWTRLVKQHLRVRGCMRQREVCILICEARSNLKRLKYVVIRRMKGIIYDRANVRMRGTKNGQVTGGRDSPAQLTISWSTPPPPIRAWSRSRSSSGRGVFHCHCCLWGSGPGFL